MRHTDNLPSLFNCYFLILAERLNPMLVYVCSFELIDRLSRTIAAQHLFWLHESTRQNLTINRSKQFSSSQQTNVIVVNSDDNLSWNDDGDDDGTEPTAVGIFHSVEKRCLEVHPATATPSGTTTAAPTSTSA